MDKVQIEYHGVTLYVTVEVTHGELEIVKVECEEDIYPLLDRWTGNKDLDRFYDAVCYEHKWGER